MPKTENLGLTIINDDQTTFKDFRESINGDREDSVVNILDREVFRKKDYVPLSVDTTFLDLFGTEWDDSYANDFDNMMMILGEAKVVGQTYIINLGGFLNFIIIHKGRTSATSRVILQKNQDIKEWSNIGTIDTPIWSKITYQSDLVDYVKKDELVKVLDDSASPTINRQALLSIVQELEFIGQVLHKNFRGTQIIYDSGSNIFYKNNNFLQTNINIKTTEILTNTNQVLRDSNFEEPLWELIHKTYETIRIDMLGVTFNNINLLYDNDTIYDIFSSDKLELNTKYEIGTSVGIKFFAEKLFGQKNLPNIFNIKYKDSNDNYFYLLNWDEVLNDTEAVPIWSKLAYTKDLDNFVEKTNTALRVYATDGSGNQNNYPYSDQVVNGSFVKRTTTGTVKGAKAVANDDLVPLSQVKELAGGSEGGAGNPFVSDTFANIKALRDSNSLVVGNWYEINDFETTTTLSGTQSDGTIFKIVILAISTNSFGKEGYVSGIVSEIGNQRVGDLIWYGIDETHNNTKTIANGGKGVIYRYIDKNNNDLHYDFKSIKTSNRGNVDLGIENGYYYTFDNGSGDTSNGNRVRNNFIRPYIRLKNIYELPKNLFYGTNFYSNTIGTNFYSNTIGDEFYSNTIGNDFTSNTIGNYFESNTIGDSFRSNTIGNNFRSNTIGNYFYSNIIGNYFYHNTIGNNNFYLKTGNKTNAQKIQFIHIENGVSGNSTSEQLDLTNTGTILTGDSQTTPTIISIDSLGWLMLKRSGLTFTGKRKTTIDGSWDDL